MSNRPRELHKEHRLSYIRHSQREVAATNFRSQARLWVTHWANFQIPGMFVLHWLRKMIHTNLSLNPKESITPFPVAEKSKVPLHELLGLGAPKLTLERKSP